MNRNVLVCLNFNNQLTPKSRASMEDAAGRWGAEFLEITEAIDPEYPTHEQKWLVYRLFQGSQVLVRACVVEPYVLIRADAPSIFEQVPEGKIGATYLKQPGNSYSKRDAARVLQRYAEEKGLEWDAEGVKLPRQWGFDVFTFDWPRHKPFFEDMIEEAAGSAILKDPSAVNALWTKGLSRDGLIHTLPNCWAASGSNVWQAQVSFPAYIASFCEDPQMAADAIEKLDWTDSSAVVDEQVKAASVRGGTPEKVVIFYGPADPRAKKMTARYAKDVGLPFQFVSSGDKWRHSWNKLKNAALVVIWNGKQGNTLHAALACKQHKIPTAFLEWGMLPQKTTYFVDVEGLHESSMLMGSLSWVRPSDLEALHKKRAELQKRFPLAPSGHVLVPLQICNDTSVTYSTTSRTMSDFMEIVQDLYPQQEVVVRPHPKSGWAPTNHRFKMSRNPPEWLAACAQASAVVGQTSTTLVEAAVLGVPVVALGDCPLRNTPRRLRDRLLAAYNYLTVDRDTGDLRPILERFNVHPVTE